MLRAVRRSVLLLALCCAAASARAAPSGDRIAIVWTGTLPDDAVRGRLEGAARGALAQLGDVAVQPAAQTAAHVDEAAGLGVRCVAIEPDCASRLGALAGVDAIVQIAAAPKGAAWSLAIGHVDVDPPRVVAVVDLEVDPAAPDAGRRVEEAVVRAVAPARFAAALDVAVDRPGAEIFVDGRPVGRAPLSAPVPVLPGPHDVQVRLPGYEAATRAVDAPWGRATIVDVRLAPVAAPPAVAEAPEAPLPSPLVLGGGAALAVGGLVAVGTGAGVLGIEGALSSPVPWSQRETLSTTGQGLVVAAGVGVAAAAIGGAILGYGLVAGDGAAETGETGETGGTDGADEG